MSDSIGRINLNAWASDPDKPKTPIEAFDAGARAVALHVLEVACPDSTILAEMKAGASFEEAVERDPERRRRAAEHIDEPTETELAAAVGEIFAGIAAPTAQSGS